MLKQGHRIRVLVDVAQQIPIGIQNEYLDTVAADQPVSLNFAPGIFCVNQRQGGIGRAGRVEHDVFETGGGFS